MDVTIDAAVAALQWLDAHLSRYAGEFVDPSQFQIDDMVQHIATLDQYLTGKHDVTHERSWRRQLAQIAPWICTDPALVLSDGGYSRVMINLMELPLIGISDVSLPRVQSRWFELRERAVA